MRTPTGITVDAISPSETLEQALAVPRLRRVPRRATRGARAAGRYLGVGISVYVEPTAMGNGLGVTEGAIVRIDTGGKVQVTTTASSQGHSIETTMAQVVADTLSVDYEDVSVMWGDTATQPLGTMTGGSRNAVMGGGAALRAASELRQKILTIAAHLLEASVDDLELVDGVAQVRGVPASARTLAELASISYIPTRTSCPRETTAGLETWPGSTERPRRSPTHPRVHMGVDWTPAWCTSSATSSARTAA